MNRGEDLRKEINNAKAPFSISVFFTQTSLSTTTAIIYICNIPLQATKSGSFTLT